MKFKKHINKNEYLLTQDGIWVRNMCNSVPGVDINNLTDQNECLLYKNENVNQKQNIPFIDNKQIFHPNIVVVSDGYNFEELHQKILPNFPKDITIIGTNRTLSKWKLVGEKATKKKAMNYYVVNNPYPECLRYLPRNHRYFPRCVSSTRTNPEFLEKYEGEKYLYTPIADEFYAAPDLSISYKIDDYRNPICAAINLAYRFGVRNLLLLCCDNAFKDERPGAVKTENGLWTYPQQMISQRIIDGNLYWLKNKNETNIGNHSSANYEWATYIDDERLLDFFKE